MTATVTVAADLAISLDGYIAGTDVTIDNPAGDGAEPPLFEWIHSLASWRERQYLREGLVDELQLHVVPALLGAGLRPLRGAGCRTEGPGVRWVVETPLATYLNYRFVR
ncbi:hypothetical protein ABTX82_41370 [Streptomyces lavendulae]|uniref:hypothetical protein n=1 Tax=Streptomyces lavendulae TaxID=1914 RepID=UPI00332DC593